LKLRQIIYFQKTGLSPASAKLAVKYRPGRWNTGHLATLLAVDAVWKFFSSCVEKYQKCKFRIFMFRFHPSSGVAAI